MAPLPAPPAHLIDGASLLLDFDGTLVELAHTPDAIRVGDHLVPMLERLAARLQGRLAIVSGRALADLARHLPAPAIARSGSHGAEIVLADGQSLALTAPPGLDTALARIRTFAASRLGLLVEAKPAGVALHYRRAPEEGPAARALMDALAADTGMAVQHGKMVAELRAPGIDKGHALRTLMAQPAFRGGRPLFVGDDLTDEHAFAAAAQLGGAGVLVGPARKTRATYRLPSVEAVATWLGEETCAT